MKLVFSIDFLKLPNLDVLNSFVFIFSGNFLMLLGMHCLEMKKIRGSYLRQVSSH